MMIRTANQQHAIKMAGGNYRAFVARECAARWQSAPNWDVRGEPLMAWVTNSDWVVSCDACAEQMVAEPGEPYFCPGCLNAGNGGAARPVTFPRDRQTIETLLLRRTNPYNRCYLPSETADDLREQNEKMGW